ncbi:CLUMA_CG014494, isoform A [Clunio marinus]|uniref:CLUMA_CG014494, isoform A n=1 Tax=Clunio marinus TaxID=568069 RepID=A0A1J1IQY2_9DIPT|nr:CLUMA_CG014494, isoform A [Clunio marinus]
MISKIFILNILLSFAVHSFGGPIECRSANAKNSKLCIESRNEFYDNNYESVLLCQTRKEFIRPEHLIESSSKDKWDFDPKFSQTIEVELCENPGSFCFKHPIMKAKCVQRFVSIKLQVMNQNKTLSELQSFTIPSNCECSYYKPKMIVEKEEGDQTKQD